MRSEINESVKVNSGKKPLFEIAQNIKHLDCVIKVSQRLYPLGAQPKRECNKDYEFNGIHIPSGTEILIPIYVLRHDPHAWEDPEKFDPERFRGPARESHHGYQFLPFGAGLRNCIGIRIALTEIKDHPGENPDEVQVCAICETPVPLITFLGLSLSPQGGVMVRVENIP